MCGLYPMASRGVAGRWAGSPLFQPKGSCCAPFACLPVLVRTGAVQLVRSCQPIQSVNPFCPSAHFCEQLIVFFLHRLCLQRAPLFAELVALVLRRRRLCRRRRAFRPSAPRAQPQLVRLVGAPTSALCRHASQQEEGRGREERAAVGRVGAKCCSWLRR